MRDHDPKSLEDTKIVYIPLRQLSVVWVQTQRPHNEKWSDAIANDFDPDKFDPLIVTKPNGEMMYHMVEGQHRRHAFYKYMAKNAKPGDVLPEDQKVPCRIVEVDDPARAAEIFLGVNSGRKSISPVHAFNVAVTARREPEVTINNVVVSNGYVITPNKVINNISAVRALKTVYERHGKVTLNNVLKVIRYLWKGDPAAVHSSMIRGFGLFIHEFGTHTEAKKLFKISDRWTPHKLLEAAKVRRDDGGVNMDEAIAEILLREYNRGLKDAFKLKHKG